METMTPAEFTDQLKTLFNLIEKLQTEDPNKAPRAPEDTIVLRGHKFTLVGMGGDSKVDWVELQLKSANEAFLALSRVDVARVTLNMKDIREHILFCVRAKLDLTLTALRNAKHKYPAKKLADFVYDLHEDEQLPVVLMQNKLNGMAMFEQLESLKQDPAALERIRHYFEKEG